MDDELSITELAESWINGNKTFVVDYLSKNPRHVTAYLTLVLFRDHGEIVANSLVNCMMDSFTNPR